MGLTFNQFQVVNALSSKSGATQREIAEVADLGLATVNAAYKECVSQGLIDEGRLTAKGGDPSGGALVPLRAYIV